MGKFTMEITHAELATLVAKGFEEMGLDKKMGGFDDKTLFSVYKARQGASKFTVIVEGEAIKGNEDVWKDKMRKRNIQDLKHLGIPLLGIAGVFTVMVLAAHFGFLEWFPMAVGKAFAYIGSFFG